MASEYGDILGSINYGDVIRTPEGKIIWLSEAYNPMTANKLEAVAAFLRVIEGTTKETQHGNDQEQEY